jgi:hypothetical protein
MTHGLLPFMPGNNLPEKTPGASNVFGIKIAGGVFVSQMA